MARALVSGLITTLVSSVGLAAPAAAQQAVSLNLGYVALRGEDARVERDVLLENLNYLVFELKDFGFVTFGGDYLVGLGEYLEAGAGVGYYRRTVPTVYADFVNADGTEIEQDLKLRVLPITATVRVLALGRRSRFQPYVGAGIGVLSWRYSETGEFVDFSDFSIFRDRFVTSGTSVGPVGLFGVRVPVGPDFAVGGEFRYQGGEGELGEGFLTDRIDLGGYTTQFVVLVRF